MYEADDIDILGGITSGRMSLDTHHRDSVLRFHMA